MEPTDPNHLLTPMEPPRFDQVVNPHEWENPLATEWLGAEAAVLVRDGRWRRPLDRRLIGVMLVSLGFAVGFLAGGLTWYGVGELIRKKHKSSP